LRILDRDPARQLCWLAPSDLFMSQVQTILYFILNLHINCESQTFNQTSINFMENCYCIGAIITEMSSSKDLQFFNHRLSLSLFCIMHPY